MATELQIKLNNIKLFKQMNQLKQEAEKSLQEKEQAKNLIIEYKTALEDKNKEMEQVKKEKELLEEKMKNIPDFVKNFFQN